MKKIVSHVLGFIFVVLLAACGGNEANDAQNENVETDETVTIKALNWHFDEEEYVVPSGETTIELINESGNHGIIIREANGGEDVVLNKQGSTIATLAPGEYDIICSIPCGSGHADMTATLVVT
ncbi:MULTISPECIES: cupredoxin domain-containing protein [Shouchella]|uniref:Cupredoxin domain-containing protein n=2 Tax=Shouchella TaxID=2893057 RepID=A0ABY7W1N6_9BACI|nr:MULTISPECIES: cupredoxin domain-containing protein [Shouchella]MED4130053.1 cupredoxin domain-containing protein [Shouchella miscanthi]WDF02858.1 cupredoxin domain-containing protein [Shouchella hunanensis]GAF24650.1 hypothetical protein JCM19047_4573 [Bacillus sp. JCM 19047]